MKFRFLPRTRGGSLWRAFLGTFLVVGFTAGAVATAALLQVQQVVNDFHAVTRIHLKKHEITLPAPGAPQTLLLVGSDHRYGQGNTESNTDTMILVRLNDASSTINVLSIPRDLEVHIPIGGGGYETTKINAAWAIGGPSLLIDVLKTQVFPGLQVNHILNIDFGGFTAVINAIGCVYTMVDHRYYNNTAQTDYSSIDIQPGYQKLCGGNGGPHSALAFVRFRHTDSDLVREARQQDFLRWAKDQYSTSQLLSQRNRLLKILAKHLSTDANLVSQDGLINLFNLAINANGHTVNPIRFPVTGSAVINGADYLTSTVANSEAVYKEFMAVTKPKPTSTSTTTSTTKTSTQKPKSGKKKGKHGKRAHRHHKYAPPAGMYSDTGDGKSQAGQLGHLSIPVYYPQYIPGGTSYCFTITSNCNDYPNPATAYKNSYPRRYMITGRYTRHYRAYAMTLVMNPALGEYINVQGTAWQNPPILAHPTKVQTVNGKKLYEFYNGPGLSLVAWHTPQGVYWISNTLRDDVPPAEMIAMAATLTPASV